jgi:nitrogen fixation protein NifU and related proteins
MNSEELYREIILDHAKRPRNFGDPGDANVRIEAENPLCGDELTLFLKCTDSSPGSKIEKVAFTGQACAICTASASLLTLKTKGRTLDEAEKFSGVFQEMLRRRPEEPVGDVCPILGDLSLLEGVRKFPMRVKCATMPWHALDAALREARRGGGSSHMVE